MFKNAQDHYVGDGYFKISATGIDKHCDCQITIDYSLGGWLITGFWQHYSAHFNTRKMVISAEIGRNNSDQITQVKVMLGNTPLSGSFYTRGNASLGSFTCERTRRVLSLHLSVASDVIDVTGIWAGRQTIYFNQRLRIFNPLNAQSNVVGIGGLV